MGNNNQSERWLDNADLKMMLHVSTRTLQSWRSAGIIPFAKIGGKLFYKLSDIEGLLNRSYRTSDSKAEEDRV